jgi:hypothetical protein
MAMLSGGGGKRGGVLALGTLLAMALLTLAPPVYGRPVVPGMLQGLRHGDVGASGGRSPGGGKETKAAARERLVDMVKAGEASAALVRTELQENPITAEEESKTDTPGGESAQDGAATTGAEQNYDGGAPLGGIGGGPAVAAVGTAALGGNDPSARTTQKPKPSMVSQFSGYFSSGVSAVKLAKTSSFFYKGAAPGVEQVTDGNIASTTESPAVYGAAAAAAADAEHLRAVLAQVDAAETMLPYPVNFVKPSSGDFRDATVRPEPPIAPALPPLSYQNMRQHYTTEVRPTAPRAGLPQHQHNDQKRLTDPQLKSKIRNHNYDPCLGLFTHAASHGPHLPTHRTSRRYPCEP